MCDKAAAESCPVWFGDSVQVHWGLADPSLAQEAESEQAFKHTINIIERRIQQILDRKLLLLSGSALKLELYEIAKEIK